MAALRPRPGIRNIRAQMLDVEPGTGDAMAINIFNNENAFGPSPRARAAAVEAIDHAERYAEGASDILSKAIAETFGIDASRIVCGSGSDDILARLARAYLSPGDQLICNASGYQKIPNYAYANDAEPVAAKDDDLKASVDAILAAITQRTRIVMIANPDNPSGLYLPGEEVRRLHAALPQDVLLVLDCAYREYVDAPDYEDPVGLVEEFANVAATRTFSKIFGLAGLRLGWMYGAHEIVDAVRRIGITFPISTPGLAAGVAAMADVEHTRMVFETTRELRSWFAGELTALGLSVYPSQTNFVLARFRDPEKPAEKAYAHLIRHKIFPRRFMSPTFKDFIRFTIGQDREMRRTRDVLGEYLKG